MDGTERNSQLMHFGKYLNAAFSKRESIGIEECKSVLSWEKDALLYSTLLFILVPLSCALKVMRHSYISDTPPTRCRKRKMLIALGMNNEVAKGCFRQLCGTQSCYPLNLREPLWRGKKGMRCAYCRIPFRLWR